MMRVFSFRAVFVPAVFSVFAFAGAAAPVTIGGVSYDTVDEGEPFVELPAPAQDWAAPKPRMAESRAGM